MEQHETFVKQRLMMSNVKKKYFFLTDVQTVLLLLRVRNTTSFTFHSYCEILTLISFLILLDGIIGMAISNLRQKGHVPGSTRAVRKSSGMTP